VSARHSFLPGAPLLRGIDRQCRWLFLVDFKDSARYQGQPFLIDFKHIAQGRGHFFPIAPFLIASVGGQHIAGQVYTLSGPLLASEWRPAADNHRQRECGVRHTWHALELCRMSTVAHAHCLCARARSWQRCNGRALAEFAPTRLDIVVR